MRTVEQFFAQPSTPVTIASSTILTNPCLTKRWHFTQKRTKVNAVCIQGLLCYNRFRPQKRDSPHPTTLFRFRFDVTDERRWCFLHVTKNSNFCNLQERIETICVCKYCALLKTVQIACKPLLAQTLSCQPELRPSPAFKTSLNSLATGLYHGKLLQRLISIMPFDLIAKRHHFSL